MKTTDRSFQVAQGFLLAAKGFWTTTMFKRLHAEYAEQCALQQKAPQTVPEVAEIVEGLTTYRYFAWLERHLQSAKYSGRYGLVPYYRQRQDEALGKLEGDNESVLQLDPALEMPAYYVATDIHQHPGGVWSEPTAGLAYEHGARTTTPLLGQTHADLHTRFTDHVAALGEPRRVLDMGCGFGKSTLPFARRFPASKVEGVDLSAPCLKVAAHAALSENLHNVIFRQSNAAETLAGEEGGFDLVTSTMLLHEMPPRVLGQVLDESFRSLEPGGRMVHLDFWHLPDPFTRFLHYGHGRRNNEPYMQPLAELDLPELLSQKGFVDIEIEPFSEVGGTATDAEAWRFPWTVISARKPLET
ncbi:MAG: class I SAM-dependent methyltransferase [Burkholderiales bacterium]|nr:MAG: class I SAM-dependent methyltransferase [Burkholderiales bacterium]